MRTVTPYTHADRDMQTVMVQSPVVPAVMLKTSNDPACGVHVAEQ